MPTLYTWDTPNGQKPAILLEELGVPFDLQPIDITSGAQFEPSFTDVNPNSKIPALVDDGMVLFESGAILQHLADKHHGFLARSGQERAEALSWCYWQVGGLGPMIGQWAHFAGRADLGEAATASEYAVNRYLKESVRLLKVLDERLGKGEFLAGGDYTIADIMSYPWVIGGLVRLKPAVGADLPVFSNVERWISIIESRPAVKRAMGRVKTAVEQASE